jgi:RND family efflux transporter MFP subunit
MWIPLATVRQQSRVEPSLHVVAPDRSALVAVLEERLGRHTRVRHHATLPPVRTLGSADLLVIDLDDGRHSPDPRQLLPLLARLEVWLVYGDCTVSAHWLDAARWPNVHFVHCDEMERAAGLQSLTASLLQRVAGPSSAEIAALVLAREPGLEEVEPLVRAVCEGPWEVRHPAQLAAAAAISLAAVKRTLEALGFDRVEHFITYVRWVVFEQLVGVHRLRVPLARRLAGIGDPSNLRRQMERARRGSARALRRLKALGASLAILLVPLTGAACRDRAAGQGAGSVAVAATAGSDSAIALPVVGAEVRRGDLIITIRTTGQVRAERQVSLKGEAQGTVDAVLVRPGDRVENGQVLVRLDVRPLDLAVREADSQLEEARGRYGDILLGEDTTDAAPGAVERRRNARLRTGVDGAEARLERAKLDRERATMRAPFGGTVDQVQAVVGQRVGAGDPIATVVDLGSLIVEAAVLEHDLPLVRRGAMAAVTLAAANGRAYPARVLAVLPLVDTTTRSGRALVRVRTGDGVLRPGMYADVELEATRLADRVIVPAPAIIERDGRPLVFRYHAGKAEWVYVTPGRSNGRETEILPDSATGRPAVQAGDTVLVEGHLTLTHDAPVRILSREASPAKF